MFDLKLKKPKFWDNKNLSFFSIILSPLSLLTIIVNFIKKFQNKKNYSIKTICIGNIYIGGTGKTPLAIKINDKLKNKFKTVFIKKNYLNQIDEQKLLKSNGSLIVSNKRHIALKKAIKEKYNLAIIDDGLQEKGIKYDVSVACFNGVVGFGNGMVLPAGPLRESLNELKFYDAVFINNMSKKNNLDKKIKSINKDIKIFYGKYILSKKKYNLKKNYIAFCGIGNPKSFLKTLKENSFKVSEFLSYPDHYNFSKYDLIKIKKIAETKNLSIITTEKDYIRLNGKYKNEVEYLKVSIKINNEKKLFKYLNKKL
tara:strand:- start:4450 stop:5385 length:936 start_codon:yes stop_codon:yes gene_type:complete